jgi:hypothetical protein
MPFGKIHAPSLRQKECSMEEEKNTRGYERYVALDIHKEYVMAGGSKCEAGVGDATATDQHGEVP